MFDAGHFQAAFWVCDGWAVGSVVRGKTRVLANICLQRFRLPLGMRQPENGLSGLLSFGHHPAHAAYVFNMLFADFFAQAVNQEIDGVAFHFFAPAVDFVFKVAAGEDVACATK